MISIRMPPDLLRQLDAFREGHEYPPQRTAVIVEALRRYLSDQAKPKKKP